ncbi:hypothetical protein L2E82_30856 [Cichorium intybus]|uniref:Uncharacterized protein n=1 Tax=Cichorium intybus TaxID=13427 RepID=A0ACB9D299_CICIN|nr:hypothetical protein L2E82_30856 [Cichorium intybus]
MKEEEHSLEVEVDCLQSYYNSNSPQDIDDCYENFCKFYADENGDERKMEGNGTEENNSIELMDVKDLMLGHVKIHVQVYAIKKMVGNFLQ